ncbi:hypothetical protein SLEP1_g13007 [Rubroshorea leprosula]|uniref:Uncharacterized protein n=1 Tax=Rubroshorea leprosula TaxID=152421 RepID=A0AAV5IQS6_9ROSI|nr:hypothetical protein SLEP1_g13007 [Rubroshorea leprosula]
MIIKSKLTYPSGAATAHLISSFHTHQGAKLARKQVIALGKFFSFSFLWSFFQWFFTAADGCGFANFPHLISKPIETTTYVGVGMICPHLSNISLPLGAIFSWGIMWPLIEAGKGDWYTTDHSSLHSLQGYRVFIAIAMIIGDGLYNFVKVLTHTLFALHRQLKNNDSLPVNGSSPAKTPSLARTKFLHGLLWLVHMVPCIQSQEFQDPEGLIEEPEDTRSDALATMFIITPHAANPGKKPTIIFTYPCPNCEYGLLPICGCQGPICQPAPISITCIPSRKLED